MNKIKFRTRVRMLIVLTLLLVSLVGFAVGKYKDTFGVGEGTFTVEARLADSLTVVNENYLVMPGVDITTANSKVVITGKTKIPAYLYLTVTDSTNEAITITLKDHWIDPDNDGTYIYSTDGTNGTPITNDATIDILQMIEVSHTLLSQKNAPGSLSFSTKLEEVVE